MESLTMPHQAICTFNTIILAELIF
jgi:hypothetical protein